jgi:hypothetical protein
VRVSNRICRQDGSRRMANSSNVVREGDDGLQKKSQRIFCVQRGGARVVLYCMPDQGADQKKKGPGELEPKSRRRDGDA